MWLGDNFDENDSFTTLTQNLNTENKDDDILDIDKVNQEEVVEGKIIIFLSYTKGNAV